MDKPKLFLTKTWGFGPEGYPAFGFSTEGARNNFLRDADRDDLIVIAGTRAEPTIPDERGRLIGLCQVAHEKIDALKLLEEINYKPDPHELDAKGQFKWPYAMPIFRAWRFKPMVDLKEIVGSYLPGNEWAAFALNVEEKLGSEVARKIRELPTEECSVPEVPSIVRARVYADTLSRRGGNGPSGPPPSGQKSGSERELGEGYSYAFRLTGGPNSGAIKVGSSHDPRARIDQLNREIRPHLTGCKWVQFMVQKFPTERLAYNFEQLMILRLKDCLVEGDTEVFKINSDDFKSHWTGAFASKRWIDVEGGEQ